MPNTKLTKERMANHFDYSKKIYIFVTLAVVCLANILYAMTSSQIPNERSVEIALVDNYVLLENVEKDEKTLLAHAQTYDSSLEQVKFMQIAYNEEVTTDDSVYGAEVYMVQITAGTNDIFILPLSMAEALIKQGNCLPMDRQPYFDDFIVAHPEVELYSYEEPTKKSAEAFLNGEEYVFPEDTPTHIYAVDVSVMQGMISPRNAYNVNGKVAVLYATGKNPDTSLFVLSDMFSVFAAPEE